MEIFFFLNRNLRHIPLTILYFAFWMRPAECKELSWNDPVQVSIFCSLIVLIFFHIKVGEVEPAVLQCLVHGGEGVNLISSMTQQQRKIKNSILKMTYLVNGPKAIQDVQIVHAGSKRSISVT